MAEINLNKNADKNQSITVKTDLKLQPKKGDVFSINFRTNSIFDVLTILISNLTIFDSFTDHNFVIAVGYTGIRA